MVAQTSGVGAKVTVGALMEETLPEVSENIRVRARTGTQRNRMYQR